MLRPPSRIPLEHQASMLEGAPAWVTEQLIASTLRVWQPFYNESLTAADALEILLGVGQLLDVLGNPDD
jgi:hypothetical protein